MNTLCIYWSIQHYPTTNHSVVTFRWATLFFNNKLLFPSGVAINDLNRMSIRYSDESVRVRDRGRCFVLREEFSAKPHTVVHIRGVQRPRD